MRELRGRRTLRQARCSSPGQDGRPGNRLRMLDEVHDRSGACRNGSTRQQRRCEKRALVTTILVSRNVGCGAALRSRMADRDRTDADLLKNVRRGGGSRPPLSDTRKGEDEHQDDGHKGPDHRSRALAHAANERVFDPVVNGEKREVRFVGTFKSGSRKWKSIASPATRPFFPMWSPA